MAHIILQVMLEVEDPSDTAGTELQEAVSDLLEDQVGRNLLNDVLSVSVVFEDVV